MGTRGHMWARVDMWRTRVSPGIRVNMTSGRDAPALNADKFLEVKLNML